MSRVTVTTGGSFATESCACAGDNAIRQKKAIPACRLRRQQCSSSNRRLTQMVCMLRAFLQASPTEHPLRIAGVTLVGMNERSLPKILITIGLFIALALLTRGARALLRLALP